MRNLLKSAAARRPVRILFKPRGRFNPLMPQLNKMADFNAN